MTRAMKIIGALVIGAGLAASQAAAQEKISPVSDYQYKKDYAQYDALKKEADPQKRADLLISFMKEHPISRMLNYVALDYMAAVQPHIQNKDWAKAISLTEGFVALMPTEKSVQAAAVPEPGAGEFLKTVLAPTRIQLSNTLLGLYFQANNFPKAAEIGESLYSANPDKAMAATLASIYLKMQNTDKYLEYGAKILAEFPMDQAYGTALQMAQVYLQKQNAAKAKELYLKVLDAFGDKLPPGIQEPAWNQTRAVAYSLLASDAYAQKDYPKAIELYGKVAGFVPKTDEAWYYIGMSKWRSQDPEGAIEAFARAMVLGKATAARSKEYLEQLWKARHNDSLDGLDAVIAKAKTDLGVS